jgi:uncharacterized protein (DUF58 family)
MRNAPSPGGASTFDVRGGAAPRWAGPGARRRERAPRKPFLWRGVLWSMLYPRRGQRILPTFSGTLVIVLTTAIGIAAYNTANNILFITLSLLLSCLILSGVLSWINLAGVAWRLSAEPPLRVGHTATVAVHLRNEKRLLPTYGLWFDLVSSSVPGGARLTLRERLDPRGGEACIEWTFRPTRRGREAIELSSVSSLFPFGFLRKVVACDLRQEVLVWPAPIEYQRFNVAAPARPLSGEQIQRIGQSGDLLALRRYAPGDSHRLIHWKASARLRTLMVRQFASESQEGFSLWLETPPGLWSRADQFELLCSFATALAEDLFTASRLGTVAINDEAAQPVRRLRDLEAFFDRVALLNPDGTDTTAAAGSVRRSSTSATPARARRNLLTFAPDGARGVAAYVDGNKAAAA